MIASSLRAAVRAGTTNPRCTICGGGETQLLATHRSPYNENTYELYDCQGCGSRFYDYREHPARLEQLHEWLHQPAEEDPTLDFVESPALTHEVSWLTRQLGRTPRTVLDIGCATGEFLLHWPWHARRDGLELSASAAATATSRGLRVFQGRPESAEFAVRYDVVTCYDYLPHHAFPESLLAACNRAVAPGGILALRFPTFECVRVRRLERKEAHWPEFAPPANLNHPSRSFLGLRLEELGYARIDEKWTASGSRSGLPWPKAVAFELIERTPLSRRPLLDLYTAIFRKTV